MSAAAPSGAPAPFSLYVVASTVFLLGVLLVIWLLAALLPTVVPLLPPSWVAAYAAWSPLAQLAAWELAVLVVLGWAVCALFYGMDSWTFDSFGWPLSPVYAAAFCVYTARVAVPERGNAVLACAVVYAVRLNGSYFRSQGWKFVGCEDWRYQAIRAALAARGVAWHLPSLVLVFVAQWLMVYLASAPLVLLAAARAPIDAWDALGAAVVLSGVLLECVADNQLHQFMRDGPRDRVLDTGLWRYCRHPNYVGQCLFWLGWALWLRLRDPHAPLWVLLGPTNIVLLIVGYSVRAVEERMAANRARLPALRRYQATTAALIPGVW